MLDKLKDNKRIRSNYNYILSIRDRLKKLAREVIFLNSFNQHFLPNKTKFYLLRIFLTNLSNTAGSWDCLHLFKKMLKAKLDFCGSYLLLCNYLCSSSSSSCDSTSVIRNIGEFGAKSYFTDHRTANTILYSFSELVAVEGKFPRGYLINTATCLFACP